MCHNLTEGKTSGSALEAESVTNEYFDIRTNELDDGYDYDMWSQPATHGTVYDVPNGAFWGNGEDDHIEEVEEEPKITESSVPIPLLRTERGRVFNPAPAWNLAKVKVTAKDFLLQPLTVESQGSEEVTPPSVGGCGGIPALQGGVQTPVLCDQQCEQSGLPARVPVVQTDVESRQYDSLHKKVDDEPCSAQTEQTYLVTELGEEALKPSLCDADFPDYTEQWVDWMENYHGPTDYETPIYQIIRAQETPKPEMIMENEVEHFMVKCASEVLPLDSEKEILVLHGDAQEIQDHTEHVVQHVHQTLRRGRLAIVRNGSTLVPDVVAGGVIERGHVTAEFVASSHKRRKTPTLLIPVRRVLCRSQRGHTYWLLALSWRGVQTDAEREIAIALTRAVVDSDVDAAMRCLVECLSLSPALQKATKVSSQSGPTEGMAALEAIHAEDDQSLLGKARRLASDVGELAGNVGWLSGMVGRIREMMDKASTFTKEHRPLMEGVALSIIVGVILLLIRLYAPPGVFKWIAYGISALLSVVAIGLVGVSAVNWLLEKISSDDDDDQEWGAAAAIARAQNFSRGWTITQTCDHCGSVETVTEGKLARGIIWDDDGEAVMLQHHQILGDGSCRFDGRPVPMTRKQDRVRILTREDEVMRVESQSGQTQQLWGHFVDFMKQIAYLLPNGAKWLVMFGGAYRGYQSVHEVTTAIMEYVPQWFSAIVASFFPSYESSIVLWGSRIGEWSHTASVMKEAMELSPNDSLIKEARAHYELGSRKLRLWGPTHLRGLERDLSLFKLAIDNAATSKQKKIDGSVPWYLYLHGLPGIGKSSVVEVLARVLAIESGIPKREAASSIIYRSADKFWSNFSSFTKVGVYDDVFNTSVDKRAEMFTELVRLIGPSTFAPPMAAVEDKGKVAALSAVLQTDNVVDPEIPDVSITALFRRRELYTARLDPNFKQMVTTTLGVDVPESKIVTEALKREAYIPMIMSFGHLQFAKRAALPTNNNADFRSQEILDWMSFPEFIDRVRLDFRAHCEARKGFGQCVQAQLDLLYPNDTGTLSSYQTPKDYPWLRYLIYGVGTLVTFIVAGFAAKKYFWNKDPHVVASQYAERERETKTRLKGRPRKVASEISQEAMSEFHDMAQQRVVRMDDGRRFTGGYMIDCQTIVIPHHMSYHYEEDVPVQIDIGLAPMQISTVERFSHSRVTRVNGDVALFRLSAPIRGLRSHLGKISQDAPTRGASVARLTGKTIEYGLVNSLTWCENSYKETEHYWGYSMPGFSGCCGFPIIDVKRREILGFHVAGDEDNNESYFKAITREEMQKALKAPDFEPKDLLETLGPKIVDSQLGASRPEGNCAQGPALNLPASVLTKSAYRRTPAWSPACGMAPAVLDPAQVQIREARNNVVTVAPDKTCLEYAVICAKAAFGSLDKGSPRRHMTETEILSGLDKDKSVGYPYTSLHMKRSDFADFVANELTPFGRREIEKVEKAMEIGQPMAVCVQPDLKDETLKIGKAVRTFQKLPFPQLYLGRKYFGHWHDEMTKAAMSSPSAIGINVTSSDWHKTYQWLAECDYHFDLDYKSYESTVNFQLMEAALEVINYWYGETCPYRRMYAWGMLRRYAVNERTSWYGQQSMPSGTPLTAPENTLTNYLLIASAFKHVYPDAQPRDFLQQVRLKIYGDDVILGVFRIAKDFCFTTVKQYLETLNYQVTPGSKVANAPDFDELSKLTFLKKAFRLVPGLPIVGAYVEWKTMIDQLSWSKDISYGGLVQLANSILSFAFFHGEAGFESLRRYCCSTFGLECKDVVLWEELVFRYYGNIPAGMPRITRQQVHLMTQARPVKSQMGLSFSTQTENFYGNGNTGGQTSTPTASPTTSASYGGNASNTTADRNDPGFSGRKGDRKDNDMHEHQLLPCPTSIGPAVIPTLCGEMHSIVLEDYPAIRGASSQTFQTTEDELSIDFIKRIWSIIQIISIPDSTTAGTQIGFWNMAPCQQLGNNGTYGPSYNISPLEWLNTMHRFWKGGLEFRFQIIAPRDSAGTLFLCLCYGMYNTATDFSTHQSGLKVVFDYTPTNRECIVRVDGAMARRWMRQYWNDYMMWNAGISGVDQTRYSYGTLFCYAATPVTKFSGFTNPISMVVSMRGAEDFACQYFQPMPGLSYTSSGFSVVEKHGGVLRQVRKVTSQSGENVAPTQHEVPADATQETSKQVLTDHKVVGSDYTLSKLAKNFYQVATLVIDGSFASQTYTFPGDLMKSQALFSQFPVTFWRGNATVRLTPIANAWVSGAALLVFVPMARNTVNYNIYRLSQCKNVMLDYSSATPVELQVNFQHYMDYFTELDLEGSEDNPMGIVVVQSLVPPSFQTGGQTSFSVRVEVAWEDTEFVVPRPIGENPVAMSKRPPSRRVVSQSGMSTATTSAVAQSSGQAAKQAGISPLGGFGADFSEITEIKSLRDCLKRRQLVYFVPNSTTPVGTNLMDLGQEPNVSAGYILGPYAAYAGGTDYTILAQTYAAAAGATKPSMEMTVGLVDQSMDVPVTGPVTTAAILSSTWTTGPVSTLMSSDSAVFPFTLPFRCAHRWAGVYPINEDELSYAIASTNDATAYWEVNPIAGGVQVKVYQAASDNFRAALWTGVPPVTAMLNAGQPFFGAYLLAPASGKGPKKV